MCYAYAERENDKNTRLSLENMAYSSWSMSNFYISVAENPEDKTQTYYDAYGKAIEAAAVFGGMSHSRSTGALIFNMPAIMASCGVLFKREEILYVFLPTFAIGLSYSIVSVL
jgi:hypothetical protein